MSSGRRTVPRTIDVKSLVIDPDNPRFADLRALKGKGKPTEEQMLEEIGRDQQIPTLTKAIKRSGVRNPIWVKDLNNGKYLVIDGNRRTYVLKKLLEEGATPPDGVRYDVVDANVYPQDTSDTELLLQRIALQAGQKPWLPFNEARITYELRHIHNMEEADIATELQIPLKEVKDRIENVDLMIDYVKATDDTDPKHFTYFADAPKRVKDWIDEGDKNKELYFKLISPHEGFQRIRSAATRGGLRDFATLLDHPKAFKEFLQDEDITVEEAIDNLKKENPLEDAPFLKRLGTIASQLNSLSDEQIEQLNSEEGVLKNLKKLSRACKNLLKKIGQDEE